MHNLPKCTTFTLFPSLTLCPLKNPSCSKPAFSNTLFMGIFPSSTSAPIYEIPQNRMLMLQLNAYLALDESFRPIDLSPVGVLGTNTVLAGLSQKTVLSALRDSEILADPTTALALEAVRLQVQCAEADKTLRLAACTRLLRLQNFNSRTEFSPHFLAMGLVSSGVDKGHRLFETEELRKHIESSLNVLIKLNKPKMHKVTLCYSDTRIMHSICASIGIETSSLTRLSRQSGFSAFDYLQIALPKQLSEPRALDKGLVFGADFEKAMHEAESLWRSAIEPLIEMYPNVDFLFHLDRTAGINYYNGPCFKIRAQADEGAVFSLVDGGRVDWATKFTGLKKVRMLSTGIGLELLEKQFS